MTEQDVRRIVREELSRDADATTDIDPATHDPRDGRLWPPYGVVVQIRDVVGDWLNRFSIGGGEYTSRDSRSFRLADNDEWRIKPVDWSRVPEHLHSRVIFLDGGATGVIQWYRSKSAPSDYSCATHIDNRPEEG